MKGRPVASPFPTAGPYTVPAAFKSNAKAAPVNDKGSLLGAQVRTLRIAAGLSGGRLSAACGVSRSMLSRIERGLVSPSVETLSRIAEGLGVQLSRFFGVEARRTGFSLVRAGKGISVDRPGTPSGFRHELIGHLLPGSLAVEPYRLTVEPGDAAFFPPPSQGLKFIYVLSGQAAFRYDTKQVVLQPGDALLFDSGVPHGFEASPAGSAVCLSLRFALREPPVGAA